MTATATRTRLTLHARTAADLMTSNPISLRDNASVHEAIVLFTKKGISAAPVIDAAGRPIGVISCSDVIVHDRTRTEWGAHASDLFRFEDEAKGEHRAHDGTNQCVVGELMTPAVFSVSPDTAAAQVIQEMADLKIHHLFVVDAEGVLVGVISALDVLRQLHD